MDYSDNHSKGCQICQEGKWLCIYLTYMCNAACLFCPAPFNNKDIVNSAFGNTPKTILKYLEQYPFKGISFSGGECFMVYDRLLNWLKIFKKEKPEIYFWAYTNGILVEKDRMAELKDAGLNELRFNTAATGYKNPVVLKNIDEASRIFDFVAVEIPSIPEDYEKLANVLPVLNDMGVSFLNLHEYILVPDDPVAKVAPKKEFVMNFEMKMQYHTQSLTNTERVKSFCMRNKLHIKINSCSLMKKEHQMLGRRISMGTIFRDNHEKLSDEGFLETIYIPGDKTINPPETLKDYQNADRSLFVHPDNFRKKDSVAYLVKLLPKLGLNAVPKVHSIHRIG